MYSTCLFCNRSLGANEVLELFPVGRRVAFDADKGRLWVVCRTCERWNLSPLEERWEVVEACERTFRETRMRVSTENIGLARLHEGLELVRIGRPLRPEFAAWRYGDQFGRRRRRTILYGVGAAAIGAAIIAGSAAAASVLSGAAFVGEMVVNGGFQLAALRTLLKLKTSDGTVLKLGYHDVRHVSFIPPAGEETWRVIVGYGKRATVFHGEEASTFAGLIMPKLNRVSGKASNVREGVKQLEASGGPEGFLRSRVLDPRINDLDAERQRRFKPVTGRGPDGEPVLRPAKLPAPLRIAVEMALHEEQERRALQGELRVLEAAWRDAEEIAAISDDLLLPPDTEAFLARHRSERPSDE